MKFIFAILLTLSFNSASATRWPDWVNFKGTIILSNGDTLKGYVLLYQTTWLGQYVRTTYLGFADKYEDTKLPYKKARWIKYKDIDHVMVFNDTIKQNTLIYQNLHHRTSLWRLVIKNDTNAIYDDLILPFPNSNLRGGLAPRKMILVSKQEIVEMYTNAGWFVHNSQIKVLLKRFINRRYKTHFSKKDFSDVQEELKYIVARG